MGLPRVPENRVSVAVRLEEDLFRRYKIALAANRERAQDVFTHAALEYVTRYEKGLR